eukprot:1047046-Rhodomonas_salina.1
MRCHSHVTSPSSSSGPPPSSSLLLPPPPPHHDSNIVNVNYEVSPARPPPLPSLRRTVLTKGHVFSERDVQCPVLSLS